MMIFGSLAKARAMATRCFCPPDNWLGYFLACSLKPTRFKRSIVRSVASLALRVVMSKDKRTFSVTVKWLIKL